MIRHDPTDNPTLDGEEIARRREASRQAQACNRIEGIPHEPATDPIFEALILGDIDFEQAIARIKALPRRVLDRSTMPPKGSTLPTRGHSDQHFSTGETDSRSSLPT